METLSVEVAVKKIRLYLRQENSRPYFVAVDGAAEHDKLKNSFKDFDRIYVSNFCRGDTFLDADELLDSLKGMFVSPRTKIFCGRCRTGISAEKLFSSAAA